MKRKIFEKDEMVDNEMMKIKGVQLKCQII